MCDYFEQNLAIQATLKKDFSGGHLAATFENRTVYRWHAVAEALRAFDRAYYKGEYRAKTTNARREVDVFHERYERLVAWGHDLQERAITAALRKGQEPRSSATEHQLATAIAQAIAPRFQLHDKKLHEHDVVIGAIKDAVPTLQDSNELITVRQALAEKGFDPNEMPFHPDSRENIASVVGQFLSKKGVTRGAPRVSRLEGTIKEVPTNTYRRHDIYAALIEINKHKPGELQLN
jgi:hypothetical protein